MKVEEAGPGLAARPWVMPAVALTDHNKHVAALEFSEGAIQRGREPFVGLSGRSGGWQTPAPGAARAKRGGVFEPA